MPRFIIPEFIRNTTINVFLSFMYVVGSIKNIKKNIILSLTSTPRLRLIIDKKNNKQYLPWYLFLRRFSNKDLISFLNHNNIESAYVWYIYHGQYKCLIASSKIHNDLRIPKKEDICNPRFIAATHNNNDILDLINQFTDLSGKHNNYVKYTDLIKWPSSKFINSDDYIELICSDGNILKVKGYGII